MAEKDPTLDTISDDGKGMEAGGEQQAKAAKRPFLSRELYIRILVILIVLSVTASIFVFRDRLGNDGLEPEALKIVNGLILEKYEETVEASLGKAPDDAAAPPPGRASG